MFENILGLDQLTADLRSDLQNAALPQALLLAGPRYGGKSSIAFEIARSLTCERDGRWGCRCSACTLHRGLQHYDTLLIGERYFELEIPAAMNAFLREPRAGTAFLLIRSIRKLTRRFDEVLWQEARLKKAAPLLRELEQSVEQLEPRAAHPEPWTELASSDRAGLMSSITEHSTKLQAQLPHDPVPVDMVRAIGSWAHVASSGRAKVVVLEEAHHVQDAARNATLKLLEEPPAGVYFVLTSSRRSAMIATVLSRLRVYHVPERTPDVQREVQQRIFRVPEPEQPLLAEFFRRQNTQESSWREVAARLLAVADGEAEPTTIYPPLREALGSVPARKGAEYVLDALLEELRKRIADRPHDERRDDVLLAWTELVARSWDRIASRNMNATAVIESLVVSMRRAAAGEPGGGEESA